MLYPLTVEPFINIIGRDSRDKHLLLMVGFLSLILGEGRHKDCLRVYRPW